MSERLKIAIAQMRSTEDPWENLAIVQSLCEEAAGAGARLVCFPENVLYRGRRQKMPSDIILRRSRNSELDTSTSSFAKELSQFQKNLKIHISLGSVLEQSEDVQKPYNCHWVLKPNGEICAYQKIHLFSFSTSAAEEEVTYRESDQITAGSDPTICEIEGFKVGLSICYDLRFPELYRNLVLDQKADLLLVPAAFTQETGRAHWHTLLRARAIENLSYVIASAQWGSHFNDKDQRLWCYGHTLAYDPWGELMVEGADEGDALLYIEVDLSRLEQVRKRLPSLNNIALW